MSIASPCFTRTVEGVKANRSAEIVPVLIHFCSSRGSRRILERLQQRERTQEEKRKLNNSFCRRDITSAVTAGGSALLHLRPAAPYSISTSAAISPTPVSDKRQSSGFHLLKTRTGIVFALCVSGATRMIDHLISIAAFSLIVIVIGIGTFALSRSRCRGEPSKL